MKTITVTEAKRQLGAYLKRAAAGEEIGIVSGADIISLRKVEVASLDRLNDSRFQEGKIAYGGVSVDPYEIETFKGGPVDGAANHDGYIYRKRGGK